MRESPGHGRRCTAASCDVWYEVCTVYTILYIPYYIYHTDEYIIIFQNPNSALPTGRHSEPRPRPRPRPRHHTSPYEPIRAPTHLDYAVIDHEATTITTTPIRTAASQPSPLLASQPISSHPASPLASITISSHLTRPRLRLGPAESHSTLTPTPNPSKREENPSPSQRENSHHGR